MVFLNTLSFCEELWPFPEISIIFFPEYLNIIHHLFLNRNNKKIVLAFSG